MTATQRDRPKCQVIRHWWVIKVAGYGEFAFYGTESEADEMRAHKSQWEGGIATKMPADQSAAAVEKRAAWVRYEIEHGYPRSSEREAAETTAVLNPTRR